MPDSCDDADDHESADHVADAHGPGLFQVSVHTPYDQRGQYDAQSSEIQSLVQSLDPHGLKLWYPRDQTQETCEKSNEFDMLSH